MVRKYTLHCLDNMEIYKSDPSSKTQNAPDLTFCLFCLCIRMQYWCIEVTKS